VTTPDPAAVAAIADGLTKAQRRWLKGARPSRFLPSVYVSYPPPNTHAVLKRLGLQLNSGDLTPLGLAVRAHLEGTDQ
jgi:hypothetical protein